MTLRTRERQRNFSCHPYQKPLLNVLHLVAWLATLAVSLVGIYTFLLNLWLAGPGKDRTVVLTIFTSNVHNDDRRFLFLVLSGFISFLAFVPFLGWAVVQIKNRQLGLRLQPFAYLLCLGFLFLPNLLFLNTQLQFTPTRVSYFWGIIPYNRISSYQWEQPSTNKQVKTKSALLILTLRPSFLPPHILQWPINDYDERSVNGVLLRYLPGRHK